MIVPTGDFRITDPFNGSEQYVNGNIVCIFVDAAPIVEAYLISETVTQKPASNDPRFSETKPTQLHLSQEPVSKVHMWLRSFTEDVNVDPVIQTIHILPFNPSANITLTGVVDSGGILLRDQAGVDIDASDGVVAYNISETQTTMPASFSSTAPLTVGFAEESTNHTVFVWLKDSNNKVNPSPITAFLYTPEDNILAHRPDLAFTDENQQGLTPSSSSLKVVNGQGDYILWSGIKFDPTGQNFSSVRLDRREKGYRITVPATGDAKLLAERENWDSVEINVENRITHDLTIVQNENTIYTNGEIQIEGAVVSLAVTQGRISFEPNHFDIIEIFDLVSDGLNSITLQMDEYDFCFLEEALQNTPVASTDFAYVTDTQLNPSVQTTQPVSIAVDPSTGCLTFLTTFMQAEVQFTGEHLSRMEEFGFSGSFFVTVTNDPENSIGLLTPTISIDLTSLVVCCDVTTSDPTPSFAFQVLNPPNTFAEFTIQISDTEDFSSATNLAFRVKDDDPSILTLESVGQQEVIYLNSALIGPGTIYWRVRRNQSDWTDPCLLTVRSAPVVSLEFTVDSEFIKEIGTVAKVRVKAIDALSNPVEGAKIEFDVTSGSTPPFSNTNSTGVAETCVTMPITRQEFDIDAESESIVITHPMTAQDSPHILSEITFNRVDPPPPIVRYVIFRKEFAEVRDEDEDRVLRVDQDPGSPIVRRDTSDPQPGVIFDPLNEGLKTGRDILPPRAVDRKKPPIEVEEENCNLRVSWLEAKERATTLFYDGKAVSNQHILSEEFAEKTPLKHHFNVISAFMANNKTIAPSPYCTHGETFPAYVIERIDSDFIRPLTLTTDTVTQTTVLDTNSEDRFDLSPNPVTSFVSTISGSDVKLDWINPTVDVEPVEEFVYRVRSFDIGGNNSYSQIKTSPATMQQCISGTLLTRLNSTACFEELRTCKTLDAPICLSHGSILTNSLVIKKLPECIELEQGTDYSVVDIGNENDGERAKIVFHTTGLLDEDDAIIIAYRYGRQINCGATPDPMTFIISPHDGTIFDGPSVPVSVCDPIKVKEPVAYTYGVWVVNEGGRLSSGQFVQVLLNL